jgi:hypothetical protein
MKNSVFVLPEHLLYYLRLHSRVVNQKHPKEDGDKNISIYADPVFETLLLHLQPTLEQLSQQKLIPTYSYFRTYKKGSDLKNHTDRESCEYSTTILLDCSEPNTPWEIFVDKKPFALKLGQGVIYKGIEQEHYRNACPMEYSSHVFLHYVDANGPHKDFAFDKRPRTHLVSQGTR